MRQWFAYGNYIDEVLFKNTASAGTGSCHMYLQDHLYSTVALLDVDGVAVERYEYDAYGNPYIFTSNDGVWFNGNDEYWDYSVNYGNPYLFTGREFDCLDEGNLRIQYNRNRYYDYTTGRWLTQDPIGYEDGMNLYEYCLSGPWNSQDYLGLKKWDQLINGEYKIGTEPPEDGDWEHGEWHSLHCKRPWCTQTLISIYKSASRTSWALDLMRWNEASRLWKKYLSNDGGYVFIDLGRMLQESKDARDNFIGDLRMAIIDAEKLASKEKEINIIQKGYFKNCVKDNLNWRYAI